MGKPDFEFLVGTGFERDEALAPSAVLRRKISGMLCISHSL
jgi:hypothetical protein